jgi:hypothetical protein
MDSGILADFNLKGSARYTTRSNEPPSFCDVAGRDWRCQGIAMRPFTVDSEPSPCLCIKHRVSMEVGDLRLLVCLDHREEQLRQISNGGNCNLPVDEADGEARRVHRQGWQR